MRKHGERLSRLEDRLKPRAPEIDVHCHDMKLGDDTRRTCPKCAAMTDEEYAAWQAHKPDSRIKWVEVVCVGPCAQCPNPDCKLRRDGEGRSEDGTQAESQTP